MRTRVLLGAVGTFGIGYGAFRLLEQQQVSQPWYLVRWLVAALVLHDGVLAPATFAIGALLSATVRPRARRYLQGALVTGGLVTLIAAPLIYHRGTQPAAKVLLDQDYAGHLAVVLAMIGVVTAAAYVVRVVRDRSRNVRPSTVHTSDSQ
jgi:hypothetical protein